MLKLALLVLASVGLMAEDNHPQPAPISKTERLDFPAGGVLRIDKSFGELTVEAWDRPDIEITSVKALRLDYRSAPSQNAVKELDRLQVSAERRGEEIVITTAVPKVSPLARPFRGLSRFNLEYRIKAPLNSRLTIDHQEGDVHIDNVRGDLHITDHKGQITVKLPADGQYSVDARSKLGAIDSDLAGREQRQHKFGHAFSGQSPAPTQKIFLRIGFGDITIEDTQTPKALAPLTQK